MKAAVCYQFGKPLVIEDIDIDPPKKGQVKVRIAATAICHSDIGEINGAISKNLPLLAGHESSGYVEEVGEGVTLTKPGDAVVVSLVASCGRCEYCTTGLPRLCDAQFPSDTETHFSNKQGQRIYHMFRSGTFAEYANVDQSQVVSIPSGISMDLASLLACGVITGFGAVVNTVKIEPFKSVVVIGLGGVGISAVQGSVFSGAYPVIAVDIADNKLEAAKSFGVTHTVNSKSEDAIKAIKEITRGKGADYVFVTVGNTSVMKQAISMCGKRGTTVIIGVPGIQDTFAVSPWDLLSNEKIVRGSTMGSARLKVDITHLIEIYKAGKLKLDEMITGRYPLERINEAIEAVERGEAIRNVIMFK